MNKIVNFMNWLSDMDGGWWPLLKCRPGKSQYMDARVLLKITPFFGSLAGLVSIFLSATFGDLIHAAIYMLSAWFTFYFLFRLTFSVAWNIRADSLNKSDEI